jgi:hypothetical protein
MIKLGWEFEGSKTIILEEPFISAIAGLLCGLLRIIIVELLEEFGGNSKSEGIL